MPLNESAAGGMTEEEKQEILEKEGQWTPVACSVEAGYVDYPARVEELLTESNLDAAAAEYALAGGVPGIRTPLVVIFENGMASRLISPDCDVTAFLDPAARSSAANGGEEIVLEQGKGYPFSEFRAAALMNRQGAAPDTASGTGENEENAEAFPLAPTVVVIIAAGAAAGWLLAHKRRRGKAA